MVPLGPGKFYGTSLPRPRIYTDVKFNDERVDPPVSVMDPLLSWANEAHWSMGGLSFKRLRLQGRIEGSITKLRAERERIAKKMKKNKLAEKPSSTGSDPSRSKRKKVAAAEADDDSDDDDDDEVEVEVEDDSPPPAPIATKHRRFMDLIDKEERKGEVEGEAGTHRVRRRRLVKKLGDDFDKVAPENQRAKETSPSKGLTNGGSGSVKTRTRRLVLEDTDDITTTAANVTETVRKVVEDVNKMSFKGKKSKGISGTKRKSDVGGSQSGPVTASRVRTSPRLAKRE